MYNDKAIMIIPVANGFIVDLPTENGIIPGIDINQFTEELKNMAKDLDTDDDIVSKIKKQAENDLPKPMMKKDNVHIFKDFQGALNFLADHYPHA